MLKTILPVVINAIASFLSPEDLKKEVDDFLDRIEDKIKDSSTPYDDLVLLPIIAKLRAVADIPDDIGGDND